MRNPPRRLQPLRRKRKQESVGRIQILSLFKIGSPAQGPLLTIILTKDEAGYNEWAMFMTTKYELEKNSLFRLTKVVFWILVATVVGLTLLIWYAVASQGADASHAYFVCDGGHTQHSLTPSQQSYIQTYNADSFKNDSNDSDKESANMTCYQEYSGTDPNSATSADIQNFRDFQTGSNGAVYTIQGVEHNWYWNYLLGGLLFEYVLFQLVKTAGLYVAGGKEALEG